MMFYIWWDVLVMGMVFRQFGHVGMGLGVIPIQFLTPTPYFIAIFHNDAILANEIFSATRK